MANNAVMKQFDYQNSILSGKAYVLQKSTSQYGFIVQRYEIEMDSLILN